jgi:hypothetical protein
LRKIVITARNAAGLPQALHTARPAGVDSEEGGRASLIDERRYAGSVSIEEGKAGKSA